MKITFDGQKIEASVNTGIKEISSVTVTFLPEKDKYSVQFFGEGKRVSKQARNIKFEGVPFKDKIYHTGKGYKYTDTINGKYINFYPEGIK